MKRVPFLIVLLLGTLLLANFGRGQTSRQRLSFSIFGQHQTNYWATNVAAGITNEHSVIKSILITTHNIVKAIAIDLDGPAWTNWRGASLLRKTDLTTGAEGIFLHLENRETNVTAKFGNSFLNNFTLDVTNNFSGVTNLSATNPVIGGDVSMQPDGIVPHTNTFTSSGLFYVSLDTANLKFNLIGYGTTTATNLMGRAAGVDYSGLVQTLQVAGVGTFALNAGTNFYFGTNLLDATNFISGPAHGAFTTSPATFSATPGP